MGGTHAKLSLSAAHRWRRCPGSVWLSQGLEDQESLAAREGTLAHWVAEKCLLTSERADAFIGRKEVREPGAPKVEALLEVTSEMADGVQRYLDVIQDLQIYESDPSDTLQVLATGVNHQLMVETKVTLTEECYGTSDAILRLGKTLHVLDLKYGTRYVEVRDNPQLWGYALAAVEEFGEGVENVKVHIVQPRWPEEFWRTDEKTLDELQLWGAEFREDIKHAQESSDLSHFETGDHCTYCPGLHRCKLHKEQALAVARHVFSEADPSEVRVPPPASSLSPSDLVNICKHADEVRAWLRAVEDHAFHELERGRPVDGFKLVERLGNRKWRNDADAVDMMMKAGINPSAGKIKSPAQVEKHLGGRKRAAPLVDRLVTRPITGLKMVSNSDKRRPVSPPQVFTNLETPDTNQ